ncbi:MAG: CBS domain-containing protein [Proteobacteria bacterium]|nr:CBS domain-containing protein [Pseudomonadota bacterium]
MNAGELCKREPVTVREFDEVTDAAKRMREQHVGYLVVVEPVVADGGYEPVGVLTDRDIAIGVVARGVDPRALRVGDLMTRDPVVIEEESSVEEALNEMRRIGVRRLPVVRKNGRLVGVLSMDEILETLAAQMSTVSRSIKNEQRLETELRR